jgi:hypothetical protein
MQNPMVRDNLEDIGVDGSIILKRILKKRFEGMNSINPV